MLRLCAWPEGYSDTSIFLRFPAHVKPHLSSPHIFQVARHLVYILRYTSILSVRRNIHKLRLVVAVGEFPNLLVPWGNLANVHFPPHNQLRVF